MVETPAAAMTADLLAAEADFLSIGTNDLTQYCLAMDRGHAGLAPDFDALHPAVLRLIAATAEGAANIRPPRRCLWRPGIGCSGRAGPDRLGVRGLSAAAGQIPALKARIRCCHSRSMPPPCRKSAGGTFGGGCPRSCSCHGRKLMRSILGWLQPLGGALLLPIAMLPIAGLLLRLGQPDLFNVPFVSAAGDAIFSNLGLIFAIGVAFGLAKDNNGAAGLAGAVCFLVASQGAIALLQRRPRC